MNKTIGILAGSLRKESFSKKIANLLLEMAPKGFSFKIISIADLDMYNQDFDDHDKVPESFIVFRSAIRGVDGVIFVTPEYNRSVPAVLKNAVDVGSRPYGKSVWDGKPAAIFSNAPGNLSGFGANHHLRQSLVFLNMPTMQQPEVYLANIHQCVDQNGNITDKRVVDYLQKAVDAYIEWFKEIVE